MRRLATALFAAAAVLVPATMASAASVVPTPVPPGPQSCDTMAARFGIEAGVWKGIRFTDPTIQSLATGTHTKSAYGNTITITITDRGTVDFTSLVPIEAVYVNKGNGPTAANAIYRFVPPVSSDTDLGLKPVTLSGVDHVVLCWETPTTTTVPTTTTTIAVVPTSVAPTSAAPTTPPPTTVPSATTNVVLPTSVAQTTTTAVPEFELPATGGTTSTLVGLAALLAIAGLVVLVAARRHDLGTR